MARLNGVEEFLNMINPDGVGRRVTDVVKQNGTELTQTMKQNANFNGHVDSNGFFIYPTGTTKRSISMQLKSGGFAVEVAPKTYYSPFLEFGTRYMTAQPFVFKSLDKQEPVFTRDLLRVLTN